ncbi:hypothetical protein Tco_1306182, partial [Tanacetum coccineum]
VSIFVILDSSKVTNTLLRKGSIKAWDQRLPYVPDAYEYPATIDVSDVHGAETRVHIPAHGGSEAQNGPPDSILSHEPKLLRKRRSPPLQSVLSQELPPPEAEVERLLGGDGDGVVMARSLSTSASGGRDIEA